jgi:hypothetical protein
MSGDTYIAPLLGRTLHFVKSVTQLSQPDIYYVYTEIGRTSFEEEPQLSLKEFGYRIERVCKIVPVLN